MMVVKLIWLSVMLGGMASWLRRDVEAYRQFQTLTGTTDRQRVYWRWILQSFAILAGASVVSLWLAGGLGDFSAFPHAFEPARLALQPHDVEPSRDSWIGMALGMTAGIAVVIAIQWHRLRKMLAPVRGTADALVPRNPREALIVVLLSLNAGFSEELFFRLALPLLLFQLTGSLAISFVLAAICFGLAHAYQGWKGILGTMAVGGVLTLVYLQHGSLLRVMLIHALIDIVALLVRPALTQWLARLSGKPAGA